MNLPDTEKNVVVVLSGGLDSTILTYLLVDKYGKDRVHALSYNYNQKQKEELKRASKTCDYLGIHHKVLDLSVLGDIASKTSANVEGTDIDMPSIKDVIGHPQPVTYVPFRNLILISLALSYAESIDAEYIFLGLQSHDEYGYWDTTSKFVEAVNNVASLNRMHRIKIHAPFANMSKADELLLIKGRNDVKLEYTLTCYNPDDKGRSCGRCPSCAERKMNFKKAGMVDPIEYME